MSEQANFRNSVILTLEGADHRLTPTFQAIMDIEERLGGIIGLAVRAAEGDFGLREMTVIIWATMEPRRAFDEVGRMIMAAGLARVSPAVRDLLALCLTGLAPASSEGSAHEPH